MKIILHEESQKQFDAFNNKSEVEGEVEKGFEIKGEYNYLGRCGKWDVYQPLDYLAAMDLGKNTGWWTSGRYRHPNGTLDSVPSEHNARYHFQDCTDQGIELYYLLDPSTHCGEWEFMVYPESFLLNKLDKWSDSGNKSTFIKYTNFELQDRLGNVNYDLSVIQQVYDFLDVIIEAETVTEYEDRVSITDENRSIYRCSDKNIQSYQNEEVRKVSDNAFYNCTSLSEISLPNATDVQSFAFTGCKSLTDVNLPKVIAVGQDAFEGCESLSRLYLPSLQYVGSSAFDNCTSLSAISLPNVLAVGQFAFGRCLQLSKVILPNAIDIRSRAFSDCKSLSEVDLPKVTELEYGAFFNCVSLSKVNLPNATEIGEQAFFGCHSLSEISLPNAVKIESDTFLYCNRLKYIYVNKDLLKSKIYSYNLPSRCEVIDIKTGEPIN